ncbi:MAG: hypothetical protein MJY64_00855 [archaeon]|nr:hypothetical protein [archaeon]
MYSIIVDDEVKEMILKAKSDFRLCTACAGPALVPISIKSPKKTDIKISIGNNTLYISAIQAKYIERVSIDMVYSEEDISSCPVFLRRY